MSSSNQTGSREFGQATLCEVPEDPEPTRMVPDQQISQAVTVPVTEFRRCYPIGEFEHVAVDSDRDGLLEPIASRHGSAKDNSPEQDREKNRECYANCHHRPHCLTCFRDALPICQ